MEFVAPPTPADPPGNPAAFTTLACIAEGIRAVVCSEKGTGGCVTADNGDDVAIGDASSSCFTPEGAADEVFRRVLPFAMDVIWDWEVAVGGLPCLPPIFENTAS
jgi:hypothetical protein